MVKPLEVPDTATLSFEREDIAAAWSLDPDFGPVLELRAPNNERIDLAGFDVDLLANTPMIQRHPVQLQTEDAALLLHWLVEHAGLEL